LCQISAPRRVEILVALRVGNLRSILWGVTDKRNGENLTILAFLPWFGLIASVLSTVAMRNIASRWTREIVCLGTRKSSWAHKNCRSTKKNYITVLVRTGAIFEDNDKGGC
jgi:hypothetical protein